MTDMHRLLRRFALIAGTIGVLPGCGSGTPPQIYVLGNPVAADPTVVSQMNAPLVEVRPARVPDFLDTTDIVTRGTGGLIVSSQSGRWGERFSIGLAREVSAVLTKRFPQLAVTTSARWGEPRWQVGIELEAFDVRTDGGSTLAATWSIVDVQRRRKLADERVVLTDAGTFRTDAQVVAVTGRQVDELANRIAVSLAPIAGLPGGSRSTVVGNSR